MGPSTGLTDFQVIILNALLFLLVIAVQVVNLCLARRKKYNWAVVLPIVATPFFCYYGYRAMYWVFHGQLITHYSLFALYAFFIIIIPIICRLVIRKRNKQLET